MGNEKTNYFIADPRTKLLILALNSIFVFGGAGGDNPLMILMRHIITALPLILLLLEGKRKSVIFAGLGYIFFYLVQVVIFGLTQGFLNYVLLFSIGFFVRILPNVMAAYYLVSTITVSELVCAMDKMHLSNKLIIPVIVMIRFFPVAIEESHAVSDAMRMRGIGFSGNHLSKMLEYRIIPMITCSVKVGDELSASALARGLGSPMKRTNICNIGFHAVDYLIFILTAITVTIYAMTFF